MGTMYYPEFLNSPPNTAFGEGSFISAIHFTIFERENDTETNEIDQIYLYLPTSLKNPTDVQWENKSLGWRGAAMNSVLSGNAVDDIKKAYSSAGDLDLADLGKAGLASLGGDIGELASGQISNPYIKTLFRGLGMRKFEYEFKFTPKTEKESAQVYEIIQAFRQAALPGFTSSPGLYLTYPRECQIEYLYSLGDGFKEIEWMNKFKPSVITGIDVDYASAGYYVPMRNGFPSETTLKLQFTENVLVTREDVTREGNSF